MSEKQWPIVEVIAEFHFAPDGWDDALPDRLYEELKGEMPTRKKVQTFNLETTFGPGQHQQSSQTFDRHQFFSEDGSRLAQIQRGLLTANHVQPYSDWDQFAPLIGRALEGYTAVGGNTALNTLRLHYINRFELRGEHIDIDDSFVFRPVMDEDFIQCGCMAVHPWEEGNASVTRQLQTLPWAHDHLPVLLILAAQTERSSAGASLGWFDLAHKRLNAMFKASLTAQALASVGSAKEV